MNTEPNTEVLVFLVRILQHREEIVLVQRCFKEHREADPRWCGYSFFNDYPTCPEEKTLRIIVVNRFKETAGIVVARKRLIKGAQARLVDPEGKPFRHLHVYYCRHYIGKPKKTAKMGRPRWFAVGEIPYAQMRPEIRHFLPTMLLGEKRRCTFRFSQDRKKLLAASTEIVTSL